MKPLYTLSMYPSRFKYHTINYVLCMCPELLAFIMKKGVRVLLSSSLRPLFMKYK